MKKSIETSTIKLLLFIFLYIYSFSLNAQSHLLFGEWKSYLSYQSSFHLAETNNKIFCSNNTALFSIDKDDFSIDFLNKINALNDVEILDLKFDKFNNQLIIIYKNGNIDILTDDDTYQIPEIKNNLNLLGQKEVNDICVANEMYAYLSFDFGVTQLNLKNFDFGFTCFTPFIVNNVVQVENSLFMGTDGGIYTINLSSENNPSDFLQWNLISDIECTNLVFFNTSLYVLSNDYLLKIKENNLDTIYRNTEPDYKVLFAKKYKNYIAIAKFYDDKNSSKAIFVNKSDSIEEITTCTSIIKDILIDENNKIWYSDLWHNIKWSEEIGSGCTEVFIDSPFTDENWDIETKDNRIYIATGGAKKSDFSFDGYESHSGFYILNNDHWDIYNKATNDSIYAHSMKNFLTIEPSKIDDRVFVGTNHSGILELNTKTHSIKIHNKENTNYKLDGAQGNYSRERVIDMQFDDDNNLWVSNFLALKPLVVYTKDNKWYNFKLNNGATNVGEMEVDANNNIWIKIVNNGLVVYNYNGTINDPTDDIQVSLTKSNTNLPSNNVNYIKTDLDGNVWVGTSEGPVVFECASSVFDGSCKGSIKTTTLEGIPAHVLDKVNITAIEVDGANRKWMGSTSGIYVLSAAGDNELMHFTTDNSPLFDNIISDLAYNKESGEMIIGTNKGLLSYKTKTLEGTIKNSRYAYAYPNPVPPNYNGSIAFKGLARDANVKIIDINGKLVFETKSLGGQAIWEGNDLHGNRVGSGVYTAISTGTNNFDQPEAIAIKVFFIK